MEARAEFAQMGPLWTLKGGKVCSPPTLGHTGMLTNLIYCGNFHTPPPTPPSTPYPGVPGPQFKTQEPSLIHVPHFLGLF
jgi:hypothetical protein